MASILALLRVGYYSMISYRLAFLTQLGGLVVSFVPLYFVATAIAPVAAPSIALEGGDYFGFVVIGIAGTALVGAAVMGLPGAIGSGIGNGTFESLLVTRTPLPTLLVGLTAMTLTQSFLQAFILLIGAAVLGVSITWTALPAVAFIAALTLLAYGGIGLIASAMILAFRTTGPLPGIVLGASTLLGGAYFSTTVIPGWLQSLSFLVPLTYGLRAVRRLLLSGAPLGDVLGDAAILTGFGIVLMAAGVVAFSFALRHARRAGTLSQY